MIFEVILFTILGMIIGVAAGLMPGLHPNTVYVILLSLSFVFIQYPQPAILAFIVSVAISNVFLDFIPSILFGAPDPEVALSVMPGHRMLMAGRGYEALFLTVIGGVGAVFLTILTLPLLLYIFPMIYIAIKSYIHYLLLAVLVWMVFSEKKKEFYAILVLVISGLFGVMTLNTLPPNLSLFPVLTGMFGLAGLVESLMSKTIVPEKQIITKPQKSYKGIFTGWLAGIFSGFLPGVGSSEVSAITSQVFKTKPKDFLVSLGAINTSNMIFTFAVLYMLGNTRSGAAWALSQVMSSFSFTYLILIMVVAGAVALVSAMLTIKLGKIFITRFLDKVNYRKMNITIIFVLLGLILMFSGPLGIFISLISMCLGLFTIYSGVRRSLMMNFLIFPTILFFSGVSPLILNFLGI